MVAHARARTVYEQLLELPEHVTGEVIRGVLHTQPRPAARHARAATRLGTALGPFDSDGPEGLRLEAARWMLITTHRDDARVRAEPFDAIEFALGALWAR